MLNSVWEGVLGDSTAFSAVKRGVGEYILSEYCHNDGQDGPDDADESAAAAAGLAALGFLAGACRGTEGAAVALSWGSVLAAVA